MNTAIGILIPFVGTTLGAACVFFMRDVIKPIIQKMFLGFTFGVMVAASVWSLLVPAMEMSEDMGRLTFTPVAVGLLAGIGFLLLMDKIIPHLYLGHEEPEGIKSSLSKITMLVSVITLHNISEGMVVSVISADILTGDGSIVMAGAPALAIGIAVQNSPERAIIFMPLRSEGKSKGRTFLLGTLSGIVEPIEAVVTILLTSYIIPILPYLPSFAASAMLYVVVEKLMPEASEGEHTNIRTLGFATGFAVMITLDVVLE